MKSNTIYGNHLDISGDYILNFLNFVIKLLICLNNLFTVIVKCVPFFGKREFLFAPFYESCAQFVFQIGYLLANS